MLPNFLIVGPPKSGTTSLQIYLDRHPDLYVTGEAHFFNSHYKKGIEWYEEFFKDYNNEKLIGEKTPAYFFEKEVPKRVKKYLPDIKLIFIFRDPVKRAYSQYWHNVRHGREDSDTFEDAIGFGKKLKSKYLEISKYVKYLKEWEKYFPKKNMFFLTIEEINQKKLEEILDFLGIDHKFEFGELKKYNIGGSIRSKKLAEMTQSNFVKKIPYLSEFIKRGLNMKRGKTPPMNTDTRKKLQKFFIKYNNELEKLTGLDTKIWRKK